MSLISFAGVTYISLEKQETEHQVDCGRSHWTLVVDDPPKGAWVSLPPSKFSRSDHDETHHDGF